MGSATNNESQITDAPSSWRWRVRPGRALAKRPGARFSCAGGAQLPAVLVRPADLTDRQLDAAHRAGLAGAPADPLAVRPWPGDGAPVSADYAALADRRGDHLSFVPTPPGVYYAGGPACSGRALCPPSC